MKKVKITDGIIKKIKNRLLKLIKKEYGADGMYVDIDGIEIGCWEDKDYSMEIKVRWGRTVDGNCVFQHQATIWMGDGNLDFLAGQFYEKILAADGNE